MAKLVLVSDDLMVTSRVEGAARKCGMDLVSTGAKPVVEGDCRVVLVDLRAPGLDLPKLVAELRDRAPSAAIVAFAPHVHEHSLAQARDVGCELVVTRGQLDRDAEAILARFC